MLDVVLNGFLLVFSGVGRRCGANIFRPESCMGRTYNIIVL